MWLGKLGCIATVLGLPGEHSGFRVYTFRDRIRRLLRGPGVQDNEFWALARVESFGCLVHVGRYLRHCRLESASEAPRDVVGEERGRPQPYAAGRLLPSFLPSFLLPIDVYFQMRKRSPPVDQV